MTRIGHLWRHGIFGVGVLQSLFVMIFVIKAHVSDAGLFGALILVAGTAAWMRTGPTLIIFAAIVPLVSGVSHLSIYVPTTTLNVIFSSIYISWWIKHILLGKESLSPKSDLSFVIDLLMTCIFLSLCSVLVHFPSDTILHHMWSESSLEQAHWLYPLHGMTILTQGLFFFRLLESNVRADEGGKFFIPVCYTQAFIIMVFSIFQMVADPVRWRYTTVFRERGIYFPFDDIHSFGSVLVLLLCVFLFTFRVGSTGRKIIHGTLVIGLLALTAVSFSRITYIMTALILSVFVLVRFKWKKLLLLSLALLVAILCLLPALKRDLPIPFTDYALDQFAGTNTFRYRLQRWRVTTGMIREFPWVGHGIGTYCRLYRPYSRAVDLSSSRRSQAPRDYENAHNYFLQLASDTGLLGIGLLLLIFGLMYREAYAQASQRRDMERAAYAKGLIAGVTAYLLTCIPGHPLLLPSQQFVFWFAVAAMMIPQGSDHAPWILNSAVGRRILCGAVAALLLLGYGQRFLNAKAWPGDEYGFYAYEVWDTGMFRWITGDASTTFRAKSDLFDFRISVTPYNIPETGLTVKAFLNGRPFEERTFLRPGLYRLFCFAPGIENKDVTLRFRVSKTFVPYLLGLNKDKRDLGVAISRFRFYHSRAPIDIGFHDWEIGGGGDIPGWPRDTVPSLRWTEKQAVMDVPWTSGEVGVLFLGCFHPDVDQHPLEVTVRLDDSILMRQVFDRKGWKRLLIPTPERARWLAFEVSRTWNPRRSGVSSDDRDLGVIVGIPGRKHDTR